MLLYGLISTYYIRDQKQGNRKAMCFLDKKEKSNGIVVQSF